MTDRLPKDEADRPGVSAVLFDFDGTLVDASEAICRSFEAALLRHGQPAAPDEQVRAMIGRPLREMFGVVDPGATAEGIEAYVDAYREAWTPLAVPLSKPLPGAPETVEALARLARLAVVTSRISSGAIHILEAMGLGVHFASIVGIERVERPKPHPEAIHLALRELGAPPSEAVMVGDTPDDVHAGRAAGCRAVGVTTGVFDSAALHEAGADRVIGSLSELPDLLRRW